MSASARHVRATAGSSAAIRTVGLPGPAFLDLPFMKCAGRYPVFVCSCTHDQSFSSLDICYRFLEIVYTELFLQAFFCVLKIYIYKLYDECACTHNFELLFKAMLFMFSVNPFQLFMRLLHGWVAAGSF